MSAQPTHPSLVTLGPNRGLPWPVTVSSDRAADLANWLAMHDALPPHMRPAARQHKFKELLYDGSLTPYARPRPETKHALLVAQAAAKACRTAGSTAA